MGFAYLKILDFRKQIERIRIKLGVDPYRTCAYSPSAVLSGMKCMYSVDKHSVENLRQ